VSSQAKYLRGNECLDLIDDLYLNFRLIAGWSSFGHKNLIKFN